MIERQASGVELATLERVLAALGCRLAVTERKPESALRRRQEQWGRFEAAEKPWERRRQSPALAFAQLGELAALFLSRHPRPNPLSERGEAWREWRRRLSALR